MTAAANRFPQLRVLDHPLIQHRLTHLRERHTPPTLFRQLLREASLLIGYEALRDLPLVTQQIETPLATIESAVIGPKAPTVVAVLRAGLAMADGLIDLIPGARIGHIGIYRDEVTKRPVQYYVSLPAATGGIFIVADPMFATGRTAIAAVDILNQHGVPDANIRFVALVAAPEGVATFAQSHPTVPIHVASLDERLDERAYIIPGLGDAGDRLFGTD